ncbi:MAG: lipid-binding domain protein [Bacteroidota bacterium]|jgi:hypothetical protein|nr:lipid-binding domain protein [Bacteroidota bacterium]
MFSISINRYAKTALPIAVLCFFSWNTYAQNADTWTLKKSESGISVYARDAENSSYKELKSILYLKTSLSSLVALLSDYESYPKWVYRCGVSTTIKRISELETIHYQNIVAPWPVDSRDFVVNIKLSQDPLSGAVSLVSSCIPNYIPKVKDHVRITEFRASWTLTPQKDGTVEVVYQLLVNPGGSIPAWLINLAVVDGPFETSLNLIQWIKKDKYQKAVLPFIKN